jgi:hypothetical protein
MTVNESLGRLLAHLSFRGGEVLTLDADDVSDFPKEHFELFVKHGVLQEIADARNVVCDGCDERCERPVQIYRANNISPARAFVSCELRDDVGRVAVDFERLKQWQMTERQLAEMIAQSCGINPAVTKQDCIWILGVYVGKKHQAVLSLDFRGSVLLVNELSLSLIELLSFTGLSLKIDKSKIIQAVDLGLTPAGKAQKNAIRKSKTQMRNAGWKKEYQRLQKAKPNLSDTDISKLIAKLPIADGKDSETIRKNMK